MSGDSPFKDFCDEQDFGCQLEVSCSFCLDDRKISEPFDSLSEASKAVLRSDEHCMHCISLMSCSEEAEVGGCQMEVLCEQCHFFLDQLAAANKLDWSRLPDYCFAITGCDIKMEPDEPGPAPTPSDGGPNIPARDCGPDDPQCEVDYSCKYCAELASDPAKCETRCKELKACKTGECQVRCDLRKGCPLFRIPYS